MRYQNITQEFVLHDKLRISKAEYGPGARVIEWLLLTPTQQFFSYTTARTS